MKKTFLIAVICLLAGFAAGWFLFKKNAGTPLKEPERKILYYRDPMNPAMTSLTPKKAPCGMDYVPVYAQENQNTEKRKIAYYVDSMNPSYTSPKPGKAPDGMDLVPVYEDELKGKGVHINPATVQNIGVKTETVTRRKLTRTIRTSGIIDYDETKLFNINTKFMGWAEKLHIDYTGQVVKKGEPLLDIYSPDLVSTQEEYLQAVRYRERMGASQLEVVRKEADELVQSSRRRLKYWDITDKEIASLEKRGSPMRALTIYSPADGIVTDKMVVDGQQVMAGMALYKIADLSTVWVTADIYQFELDWIRKGQQADLELSYLPDKILQGTVTYIYPYLDTSTRTAKVRIEFQNTPDFTLKPGMFATVKIISLVSIDSIAIPEQAVLRTGERDVVIISLGGGYFDPREVRLGASADGYIQILEGVKDGENVVTSAQFLIDSESNLKDAMAQMAKPENTGVTGSEAQENQEMKGMPSGSTESQNCTTQKESDNFFEDLEKSPPKTETQQNHKMEGMEMRQAPESHDMKDMKNM